MNKVEKLVDSIINELDGRKGFEFGDLDEDILYEIKDELAKLILPVVGYSLPSKEAKESKKIQLVNYIQKNLNTEVNRTDFRAGFEYCYRWVNGDLNI